MKVPLSILAFLLLFVLGASADVTFVFDYTGSAEFNDAVQGPARRAALESVAAELGAQLDHTATVNLMVESTNDPNGDTLASAGSEVVDASMLPFSGYVRGVVMEKILGGTDPNGAAADGSVSVNFGQPWDFDDNVSANAFDFKSTVLHELLHALGFLCGIDNNGEDTWGSGIGNPSIWEPFDDFVSDANGVELINDSNHILDRSRWLALRGAGVNGLFFNGPNARAANGGNPVGLYSPAVFEEGSSHSHLDDDNPALAGLMMLSATDTGPSARTLSGIERGILMDIGYTLKSASSDLAFTRCVRPAAGGLQLELSGPAAGMLRLERSSDIGMPSWNLVQTIPLVAGGTTVTIPASGLGSSTGFYRGVLLPAARPPGPGSKRR